MLFERATLPVPLGTYTIKKIKLRIRIGWYCPARIVKISVLFRERSRLSGSNGFKWNYSATSIYSTGIAQKRVFLQYMIGKGFRARISLRVPRTIYWIAASEPFSEIWFSLSYYIRSVRDKNFRKTCPSIARRLFIWILFRVGRWKWIIRHRHRILCFYMTFFLFFTLSKH